MEEWDGNDRPANDAPVKKNKGGFHVIRVKRKFTRKYWTGSEQNMSSVVRAPGNYYIITTRTPIPCPGCATKKITKAYISKTLRYERRDSYHDR